MKFKNCIKRLSDIMEKLGAGGLVIWLFRGDVPMTCFRVSAGFLLVSILMTRMVGLVIFTLSYIVAREEL